MHFAFLHTIPPPSKSPRELVFSQSILLDMGQLSESCEYSLVMHVNCDLLFINRSIITIHTL